ncbi:hypothetical protein DFR49_2301 [Hephaestia caeni]|uniref:Uncharacterized protein n=1 Tax=Hephaestia caeni TaxID=645617 RepID=A0A397PA52_9SPHN|nr:hypothetical protein [Hephaestia caeni]RIA44065.1 hypothetical protein DFR49_2301 [Hephaestia caeni]
MSGGVIFDLQALLGDDAFVRLAQAFGGTRLYVPHTMRPDHEIAVAIGLAAAERLCRRCAPAQIRVPLARELRARHYRAAGLSNAAIARRLGMTEPGVDKLFARMRDKPEKGSQPSLFGTLA